MNNQEELYRVYDSYLMSALYYMNSKCSTKKNIILSPFDDKNTTSLVALQLVDNYITIKSNHKVYLKMPLFKFLMYKFKTKKNVRWAMKEKDDLENITLFPYNIIHQVAVNEGVPDSIAIDAYNEYYVRKDENNVLCLH